MARIEVDGLELDYELIEPADMQPLVITPGDATLRDNADCRVLLWTAPAAAPQVRALAAVRSASPGVPWA
ncbi:MAG: hypothetical protein JWQ16_3033 [Novosphingobium sp.]|nr:hypothetical protein [Novosphingobium sp.]